MPSADDRAQLARFLDDDVVDRATLALVYGRRRIGKSTLLVDEVARRDGVYFEATRVDTPVQLARLGAVVGQHLGVGRVAFDDWEDAFGQLVQLGERRNVPVVLDEFGYVRQADAAVETTLAAALGPGARRAGPSSARLVLCGSAISMMRSLSGPQAALRGRTGLELLLWPDDFRTAATRLPTTDLELATRVFAVIGGVVGYATDMVGHDLPGSPQDFDRWVVDRVLSPAAPLHYEASTLLAEDPDLAGSSDLLHHSVLGAIANGSVTAGAIAKRLGRNVANLAPVLNRLVDAGFVVRHEDPIRKQRPLYALADPYLQFHYAVLEPNRTPLRSRDRTTVWRDSLVRTFDAQVRGPVFEQQARTWVERFASEGTLGRSTGAMVVGPSSVRVDGVDRQLDVLVAGADGAPGERSVAAVGEAKAGERITMRHLHRLEQARAALGPRAASARLLLFGRAFDADLAALGRHDLELVDLERLHGGS